MWKDWTEPLEVLLAKAREFLNTVKSISSRIHELPEGGKLIESPELHSRSEELAKALAAFLAKPRETWTTDFLEHYIYASSVYEDVFGFVFEYIGESEQGCGLHDKEEFPQTKEDLIKDFALYFKYWENCALSPDA